MPYSIKRVINNMKCRRFAALFAAFAIISFFVPVSAMATDAAKAQIIVDSAVIAIDDFMNDSDMEWLNENIHNAMGIIIVPELLKGGFFLGGSGGHCVFLARDSRSGKWSHPVFYTLGSVSFGLQIGAKKSQVVIMVRTQNGLDKLYASSFKLGGDVSVAAGPQGSGVASDILTDYIAFARSKGAFMGVSLEGSVIQISDKLNTAYYGKPVRPVDIIVKKRVSNANSRRLRQKVSSWAD